MQGMLNMDTLKLSLFGSSLASSLLPQIRGNSLEWETVGKVKLLSAHFDGKQSRDVVYLSPISHAHYLCLQGTRGEVAPHRSGFLWWHWPNGYVSSFLEEDSWCSGPLSHCVFQQLQGIWAYWAVYGIQKCASNQPVIGMVLSLVMPLWAVAHATWHTFSSFIFSNLH